MEYRITKVRKYGKGIYQSEKIGTQYYFVVYARLYPNKDNKRIFQKVHFILMFDMDDVWEHFNYEDEPIKDTFTDSDIKECRDEFIFGAAESLFYGNDLNEIIDSCNQTIDRYC